MIARTGYTGEDGFEIVLPAADAAGLVDALCARRACAPCGLGARDTLRLEAGMNLYGQDMDETVTPLESGLALDRRSREPARFHRQGGARRASAVARKLVGLVLDRQGRRAARASDRAYRPRRRRNHERHVQPDAQSVDRPRAPARGRRRRRHGEGRRARPRARGARREAAVRAQRQGAGRCRALTEFASRGPNASLIDKLQEQPMNIPTNLRYTVVARMGAHRGRRNGVDRHHRSRAGRARAISSISSCPQVGRKLAAAEACAVVESVKAASDVYAPIAGEVVAVNAARDERARAGEPGRVRGLALPDQARRRRRGGEAPRCARLRGDDRRRVMPRAIGIRRAAFVARHIGTTPDDQAAMLRVLGFDSRAALMDAIVPAGDPAQDAARAAGGDDRGGGARAASGRSPRRTRC